MDIVFNKSPDVKIHVPKDTPIVEISVPKNINMRMKRLWVDIRPQPTATPTILFVKSTEYLIGLKSKDGFLLLSKDNKLLLDKNTL